MNKKPLSLRLLFYDAMKQKGVRQSDIARLLGVSPQYISAYFAGKYNISYEYAEQLLDYFDLIKKD